MNNQAEPDAKSYARTAAAAALQVIEEAERLRGIGSVISSELIETQRGILLSITFESRQPEKRILHYSRIIVSVDGADKDAETAGQIFGVVFEERLVSGQISSKSVD